MSKKKINKELHDVDNEARGLNTDFVHSNFFEKNVKFDAKTFGEDLTREMHANKLLTDDDVDILADSRLDLMMNNAIINLLKDISKKKADVIKERVKDIVGIDIDFEEENKRRFKRFAVERTGHEETIYFNDGTPGGISIVTFIYKESPIEIKDFEVKINTEVSYY